MEPLNCVIEPAVASLLDRCAERFGVSRDMMVNQILKLELVDLIDESMFCVVKEYPAVAP